MLSNVIPILILPIVAWGILLLIDRRWARNLQQRRDSILSDRTNTPATHANNMTEQ